jgi:hypothetical protein
MEYLGHVISRSGIQKDPKKLKVIEQVQPPRTKKQVRSFLGKINYYAKFMPGLSKAARPLAKLTGTKVAFEWGTAQQQAFQDLKGMIVKDVVLAFPDVNKPYHVTTDASDYAIGAVLAQEDERTGVHRPITYLSKSLDETQGRYSVTEKELYAVVFALERFRPYIYGRPFTVYTDHRALIWLCGKKNPSGRLGRWSNIINQYSQSIRFIEGKQNKVADCLSRAPYVDEPESEEDDGEEDGINANPCLNEDVKKRIYETSGIQTDVFQNFCMVNMVEEKEEIDEYTPLLLPQLWANYDQEIPSNVEKGHEGCWTIKRVIDREEKEILWVPPMYRRDVMKAYHKGPMNAHPSAAKMLHAIRKDMEWKGMTKDIQDYVIRCGDCQLY